MLSPQYKSHTGRTGAGAYLYLLYQRPDHAAERPRHRRSAVRYSRRHLSSRCHAAGITPTDTAVPRAPTFNSAMDGRFRFASTSYSCTKYKPRGSNTSSAGKAHATPPPLA